MSDKKRNNKAAVAETATNGNSVTEFQGESVGKTGDTKEPAAGMTPEVTQVVDKMVKAQRKPGQTEQIHFMTPGRIKFDDDQPRKVIKEAELRELADSISQQGIVQPLVCRRLPDGSVMLIAGERRLRAATMAGLDVVPVIFSDRDPMIIALVENVQRVDLNPLDLAEGLQNLKMNLKCSSKQLAAIICKAEATVSETLSLNKLPDSVKQLIREDMAKAAAYDPEQDEEGDKGRDYSRLELMRVLGKKGSSEEEIAQRFNALRRKSAGQKKSDVELILPKLDAAIKAIGDIDLLEIDEPELSTLLTKFDSLTNLISQKRGEGNLAA